MKLKDVLLILNLIVLGTIIAIAVFIFQIGNRSRAVKCTSQVNLPALLPQKEHFGSSDNPVETEVDGFRVIAYRSLGSDTTTDRLPIFKFGDLAKRAQEYKLANKETEVNLDFAIYQLNCGLWIGTDPTSDNYGKVTFADCLGKSPSACANACDKLIYTLVTAAQAGVNVRIVYQNPCNEGTTSDSYSYWSNGDEIYKYLLIHTSFLKELGANQGNGTLQVRRAFWSSNPCDPGQMHNKFMVVSHYKGDSEDYLNTTYTSTSNCTDLHGGGKGVQSGIVVNGNEGLYKSYRKYFDLIWENCVAIEDLEINELPKDHHGGGSVPSDDYVGEWYHDKGYTFDSTIVNSTRTSHKTVLSTDEYFENFHNAVRACHESDSNCSCNCPEQVLIDPDYRGGACVDLLPKVFDNDHCDNYYQKDARDSQGDALKDALCINGEGQICSADYGTTIPQVISGISDGGGACGDLAQNVSEDGQCDYYYQKDALNSRGDALKDAWCTKVAKGQTCSADYQVDDNGDIIDDPTVQQTAPIATCIYSEDYGGHSITSNGKGSEYCKQCIINGQFCTTNTDCCSNSCVNGACASGDAADAPSGLNYISESISAYFYPMSEAVCKLDDLWNVNQNGIAKIASFDIIEWTNICYRWDTTGDSTNFSNKLLDSISQASSTPASAVQVGNSDDTIWTKFAKIGDIRDQTDSTPFIHAKDFTVKTSEGDEYVLTGSTNIEYYGVCSKGNNEIMIKSPVLFDFFQYTQSKAGRPTP